MKEIENCPGKRFLKISELRSEFWLRNYRLGQALESNSTKPFSFFFNQSQVRIILRRRLIYQNRIKAYIYTIIIAPEFPIFGTFVPFLIKIHFNTLVSQ